MWKLSYQGGSDCSVEEVMDKLDLKRRHNQNGRRRLAKLKAAAKLSLSGKPATLHSESSFEALDNGLDKRHEAAFRTGARRGSNKEVYDEIEGQSAINNSLSSH